MKLNFRVIVNHIEMHSVECPEDVDRICNYLAHRPVFTIRATGNDGELGGALTVIVESGRAIVDFLDMSRGIKLASQDEACTQRGFVSLRNDAYPELELEQIEIQHRALIPPEHALSILRHDLATGEVVDLIPRPPDDWDYWCGIPEPPDAPCEVIPF
jgi:hypothetical protein